MSAVSRLTNERIRAIAAAHTDTVLRDCLFLTLIVLLSLILYIFRLGFYSDDWVFLSSLRMSDDQSLPGLVKALYAGDVVIRQRPIQLIYLVLLYWLSGINPLSFHLANMILLMASSLLFYLVIRELMQSRLIAIALPLVYILLPHYSTDRFWVAAHQATLSIAFYFLSFYADLRAFRDYPVRLVRWKLISMLGIMVSGLAYEVTLPLFLLNPLLAWFFSRPMSGSGSDNQPARKRAIAVFAVNLLGLLLVVGFKLLVTIRMNVTIDFFSHIVYLVTGSIQVNYGTYGLGLPFILWWILHNNPPWILLALSGLLGLTIYGYLYRIAGQPGSVFFSKKKWLVLTGFGLFVFASGYAIFIVSADVWFTSTSLGNRIAIAAAIGVAMTFIGLLGWLSALLPSNMGQRKIFCMLVAMLCTSGFMINNTLAHFWITAYQEQQIILNDIRMKMPALPRQSTLVLDGVCLEQGGAYIFTGKRDFASVLKMVFNDPSLQATAITNSPRLEEEGLSVLTFRDRDFFPYRENLFLYNFEQKKFYQLRDLESARQYFRNHGFNPERECPPGFAWGWNSR